MWGGSVLKSVSTLNCIIEIISHFSRTSTPGVTTDYEIKLNIFAIKALNAKSSRLQAYPICICLSYIQILNPFPIQAVSEALQLVDLSTHCADVLFATWLFLHRRIEKKKQKLGPCPGKSDDNVYAIIRVLYKYENEAKPLPNAISRISELLYILWLRKKKHLRSLGWSHIFRQGCWTSLLLRFCFLLGRLLHNFGLCNVFHIRVCPFCVFFPASVADRRCKRLLLQVMAPTPDFLSFCIFLE